MRAPDEETESPTIEHVEFPLTVCTVLSRRYSLLQQVPVQVPFRRHRRDCGEQGEQGTLIEVSNDGGDRLGRGFWDKCDDEGFA